MRGKGTADGKRNCTEAQNGEVLKYEARHQPAATTSLASDRLTTVIPAT